MEKVLITLENIELSFLDRVVLEIPRLAIHQFDRFLGKYNILVLDEPTNFLDVFSIGALERFLKAYEGTVLLVSHDSVYIEHAADCIYVIEEQKLKLVN